MTRIFLTIAALLGGTSVAAGAFASHAIKEDFTQKALDIFETGVKYQMYHALALVMVALLLSRAEASQKALITAGIAFIFGTTIFSGSLYALSFTGIQWLGAITPVGGVGFLMGWGCLAIAALGLK